MLRLALACSIVAALLAASPVYGSRQLDARSEPSTSGPLTLEASRCAPDVIRHEGARVGDAIVCVYLYSLSTVAELDALQDYGVVWIQAKVEAAPGWCATAFDATAMVAEGEIESSAPRGTARTSSPTPATVELPVDAAGSSWDPGNVSQRYIRLPSELTARVFTDDAGDNLELSWEGSTRSPVALAGGAQFSFPTLGSPSPAIRFGITRYGLVKKKAC